MEPKLCKRGTGRVNGLEFQKESSCGHGWNVIHEHKNKTQQSEDLKEIWKR